MIPSLMLPSAAPKDGVGFFFPFNLCNKYSYRSSFIDVSHTQDNYFTVKRVLNYLKSLFRRKAEVSFGWFD